MIKKTSRGWEVIAHKSGRSMGIYPRKTQAEVRLKQIERSKYRVLKKK
jgi:hypothetical protein